MKVYSNILRDVVFDEKYSRQIIYGNDGIYCNHHKKLTHIMYEDSSEEIDYKGYHLYIDKTKETFGEVISYIPYDHLYCDEQYEKKNIGYDIYYVKCSYFDQTSYYFELSTISDLHLDTIISFLSNE